jgi:hypothetical protein
LTIQTTGHGIARLDCAIGIWQRRILQTKGSQIRVVEVSLLCAIGAPSDQSVRARFATADVQSNKDPLRQRIGQRPKSAPTTCASHVVTGRSLTVTTLELRANSGSWRRCSNYSRSRQKVIVKTGAMMRAKSGRAKPEATDTTPGPPSSPTSSWRSQFC